ncbi:MAG: molybdenum cofactor biosynthesis protein MoaE [Akkermansiaceae bacterium]|nr:molybdenum cofactor biosynthesis protein MoaE [Akkermansiaceae bacterium]
MNDDMPIRFSLAGGGFDANLLADELTDHRAGARVMFDGRVRNHNEGSEVACLEYQAYPAMALKVGQAIIEDEAAKHGLLRVRAVHRTGALEIGESAVWVGVASAHRAAAFDGARAIMERLKYELPVWKKETYLDGRIDWVGPDNKSAETGMEKAGEVAEWDGRIRTIYISDGHDFRGRHGLGRQDHGIRAVDAVLCVAGMGLKGDRYFGMKEDYKGQITFFDARMVEAVRGRFGLPDLEAGIFRRNVIVEGVDLSAWVGRKFRFQGVEFEGSEECKPCYWMDEAVAPGVEDFLKPNCGGGLRARILSDGMLKVDAPGFPTSS